MGVLKDFFVFVFFFFSFLLSANCLVFCFGFFSQENLYKGCTCDQKTKLHFVHQCDKQDLCSDREAAAHSEAKTN